MVSNCITSCISKTDPSESEVVQSVDDLLPENSIVLTDQRGWRAVLDRREPLPDGGSMLYFDVWGRATVICPDPEGAYDGFQIGAPVNVRYHLIVKKGEEASSFGEHYGKLIDVEKSSY